MGYLMCTFSVHVGKLQEFSETYIIFDLANNIYQSNLCHFEAFELIISLFQTSIALHPGFTQSETNWRMTAIFIAHVDERSP